MLEEAADGPQITKSKQAHDVGVADHSMCWGRAPNSGGSNGADGAMAMATMRRAAAKREGIHDQGFFPTPKTSIPAAKNGSSTRPRV